MATPEGHAPPAPEGWQVNWNYQYNQWFYFHPATNTSQWEYPSGPPHAAEPVTTLQPNYYAATQSQSSYYDATQSQSSYYDATQPQDSHYGATQPPGSDLPPTAGEPAPGERGKTQTALAAGGGFAAGAFLEHKLHGSSAHHHGNHGLGSTMAGLLGTAAGAGLGATLAGLFGGKQHGTPAAVAPAHPGPVPAPHTPVAQGAVSTGPAFGGPANFAAGGTAGTAAVWATGGAANLPQSGATTTGAGMSSFVGGFAYSGPRLIIHAATYADRDVTAQAMALVTYDQVLSLNCEKLNDEFGDPWPENGRKGFNVLYQYGDRPLEVWAGSTASGRLDIKNEALSNARMGFINKDPGRIIAVIWGQESVLNKERLNKLETAGELDCSGLGDGGFWSWEPRTLVCYYRTPNGSIGVVYAREGGTIRLPWNPLAKWS